MTESFKLDNMNEVLKEKFQVTHDLPGVFFDPHAVMDNDDERSAVEKHISVLWDFAVTKEDFEFKSVQDIQMDLDFCHKETKILGSKNVGSIKNNQWDLLLMLGK